MAVVGFERVRGNGGVGALIPGADRLAWYFLRVSGIALVGLALGHLFITHYINVPSETTFSWVAARWANPLWRAFDWVLLLASLWHGLVGLRYAITDYLRKPAVRVAAFSLAFLVGIVWTAIGTITIFVFDAEAVAANQGPLADAIWVSDLIGYSLFAVAAATYLGILAVLIFVVRSLRSGIVPIYNGDMGQYAWVMHRATGIGTTFFLLVHVLSIMLITFGPEVYNHSVEFYSIGFLIPMEVALVGAVVYHALNGLRIMAIDFWSMGVRRQRQMFWAALIGTFLLTLPAGIIIVAHEFF